MIKKKKKKKNSLFFDPENEMLFPVTCNQTSIISMMSLTLSRVCKVCIQTSLTMGSLVHQDMFQAAINRYPFIKCR